MSVKHAGRTRDGAEACFLFEYALFRMLYNLSVVILVYNMNFLLCITASNSSVIFLSSSFNSSVFFGAASIFAIICSRTLYLIHPSP
jgi:hypothetical protein